MQGLRHIDRWCCEDVIYARVVESADTQDSKPCVFGRESSSLSSGTTFAVSEDAGHDTPYLATPPPELP